MTSTSQFLNTDKPTIEGNKNQEHSSFNRLKWEKNDPSFDLVFVVAVVLFIEWHSVGVANKKSKHRSRHMNNGQRTNEHHQPNSYEYT